MSEYEYKHGRGAKKDGASIYDMEKLRSIIENAPDPDQVRHRKNTQVPINHEAIDLQNVVFPEIEGLEGVNTYGKVVAIIRQALVNTNETQKALAVQGLLLTALLIVKNQNYGNSALAPISVFSKATPEERMKVRMDDKLNRLVNGLNDADGEDAYRDLAGYLLLLLAGKQTGAL